MGPCDVASHWNLSPPLTSADTAAWPARATGSHEQSHSVLASAFGIGGKFFHDPPIRCDHIVKLDIGFDRGSAQTESDDHTLGAVALVKR